MRTQPCQSCHDVTLIKCSMKPQIISCPLVILTYTVLRIYLQTFCCYRPVVILITPASICTLLSSTLGLSVLKTKTPKNPYQMTLNFID